MTEYHAREDYTLGLKVYKAAGDLLGWLPKPMSMTVAFPLSDMPSLTFEYMKDSPGAEWFAQQTEGLEVAVMIWVPGANRWVEPPNGRFLVMEWADDVVDDHNIIRFTCPGYAWLLSKHLVMKGKNDDALNSAQKAAEDAHLSADATLKAAQSGMSNTLSDVKSILKFSGGVYALDYFPKSVSSGGSSATISDKSILYHGGREKLYWYSMAKGRWFEVTIAAAVAKIPELRSEWSSAATARANEKAARERMESAISNAREATKDGKRPMVNTTAGWVIKRHWDESKARGGNRLKGIFRTFNGTYCTGPTGVADQYKWLTRFDIDLTIGMSLLDLLNQLVEMGQIEWQFRGRHLDLFRPGLYDLDMSKHVGLHLGYDLTDAPDKATRHEFANYLVVRGEGDLSFGMANTGADQQLGWGTWEKAVSASGAKKISDAKKLVTQEAKSSLRRVKVESTRGLIVRPGGLRPMFDFLPGHRIRVYGTDGTMNRVRVMQITLHTEAEGRVNGNLVLGDRFYRTAIDFRKSLSRTVGGYEKTIGGGSTPVPRPSTERAPLAARMAPPSLAVSARVLINEADGSSGVALMMAWTPPGEAPFEALPPAEEPGSETDPGELIPDY